MVTENGSIEKEVPQDFKLVLAQKRFEYRTKDLPNVDRDAVKKDITDTIFSHNMAPAYEEICQELGWDVDATEMDRMRTANTDKLQELSDKIKDAEENAGEVEVRNALHTKADYLADIGDRKAAGEAYSATEAKTAGAGLKLDLAFATIRMDMARSDWTAVKDGIDHAHALCAKGGDWERKNRLKVYEAFFLVATREFKRSAELFLDSIATFTATELMSYDTCVFYAVILSIVALDRPTLKQRVVDTPEILSVVDNTPYLHSFLDSIYACRYADFFTALAGLSDALCSDYALHPHYMHYLREVRIMAYAQFLESYKSVTYSAMAQAFGVTPDFIDDELAEFIVANRLRAKIDRVSGVIESLRPDAKTAHYQSAIKQGDHLLNKLQKLSKAMDIE